MFGKNSRYNKQRAELNCKNNFHVDKTKTPPCFGSDSFVFSKSLLGECFSLFTNFTFKTTENQTIEKSNEFEILIGIQSIIYSFSNTIHDRNQLPSFGFTEAINDLKFGYTMSKWKRLPSPYSANCFDYKNSNNSKSRGQCMNACYIENSIRYNNCVPKDFQNLTFTSI